MAGIDLSGLTLNPIEIDDIKEFIIERYLNTQQSNKSTEEFTRVLM